jgi:hypothetical protein
MTLFHASSGKKNYDCSAGIHTVLIVDYAMPGWRE